MPKTPDQIAELREAYEKGWAPTVRFIRWAREVEVTLDETPTATLSEALRLKPAEAKELFEGIELLGLGKFIVGRRGSPSRLQWQYTLPSIAAVAMGEADAFNPVSRSSLPRRDQANELIEYVFQLRRDLRIKFSLPPDFSQQDIVRLTAFLQTLPLATED
jgi:hypothetical protein